MSVPYGKGHKSQNLINLIPPHRIYIESFFGGGAVIRHKRHAAINIGIDADINALELFPTASPSHLTMLSHTSEVAKMLAERPSSR